MKFLIKKINFSPKKFQVDSRGDGTFGFDNHYNFRVYKCFWPGCVKPTEPPATTKQPDPVLECDFGTEGCED